MDAIKYIHSIPKFIRPLGNKNLTALLDNLGGVHRKMNFIHLAGTNGKGSCAAMLSSVLVKSGYKTGLFTSPFIEVFNERIQINGVNISDEDLEKYTDIVRKSMEENNTPVSEFAFITAVMMLYFYDKQCDYIVLETGMGGKLDATNVIEKSIVSVITSVGMDHMQYLGDTVEEIACEKLGIAKANSALVLYPEPQKSVLEIAQKICVQKNVQLYKASKPQKTEKGFIYEGIEYELSLKGEYQALNGATVIEAVKAIKNRDIKINNTALYEGLKYAYIPARFEFVRPDIIIDGGHNIDGIKELKKALTALNKPICIVLAMMKDKAWEECVLSLCGCADKVICTQVDMDRTLKSDEMYEFLKGHKIDCYNIGDIKKAMEKAMEIKKDNGVVCVCGSLYLAGEVKTILRG